MKVAHEAIKVQCQVQLDLMEAVGKTIKREYCHEENDEDMKKDIWDKTYAKAYALATACNMDKHSRVENFEAVKAEYVAGLDPEVAEAKKPWSINITTMLGKNLCVAPF